MIEFITEDNSISPRYDRYDTGIGRITGVEYKGSFCSFELRNFFLKLSMRRVCPAQQS